MKVIAKRIDKHGQGENGEFLAAGLCWLHQRGVMPGTPPFYCAGCTKCEAKLAAGIVSADNLPPPRIGAWNRKKGAAALKKALPIIRDAAIRRAAYK